MTYLSFGIRDLLWAMVVVALVLGWWLDKNHRDAALAGVKKRHDAELLIQRKEWERTKETLEDQIEMNRDRSEALQSFLRDTNRWDEYDEYVKKKFPWLHHDGLPPTSVPEEMQFAAY
jgi:hypothetical protein